LEVICFGSGADLPPEFVSTKDILIEEDTLPKLASIISQNVDDAALIFWMRNLRFNFSTQAC
jgi:hypothetical protein